MNNTLLLVILGFFIYFIYKRVKQMNVLKTIKESLNSGQKVIFLDVRTKQEFDAHKIKDSINIPVDELENKVTKLIPDKTSNLVIYCLSGARSSSACGILKNMGYKNIHDIGAISTAEKIFE